MTSPSANAMLPDGQSINIEGTADPTFSGALTLDNVQFYVDGAAVGAPIDYDPTQPNATYSVPWTVIAGKHTFTLTANYAQPGGDAIDVDSAGVVAYDAVVTVPDVESGWSPNPGYAGDIIEGPVVANLNGGLDSDGSAATFVVYDWTQTGVWESGSGDDPFGTYGGGSGAGFTDITKTVGQDTDTSDFYRFFGDPGNYIVGVQCTAYIYDSSTGSLIGSVSGTGYVGGHLTDIETLGGSVMRAHSGLKAHDGSGGGPIQVNGLQLPILFGGANVANAPNPCLVELGRSVALVAKLPQGVALSGGKWTLTNGGTPVDDWAWATPPLFDMDYKVVTTPLSKSDLANPVIVYDYTTDDYTIMTATYAAKDPEGRVFSGSTTLKVFEKTSPVVPDTTVNVDIYYLSSGAYRVDLPGFTMNIPPKQSIYPFTPAPDVAANAADASGKLGLAIPYFSDYNKDGTIGDWGRAQLFWPDLLYVYRQNSANITAADTTLIENRRYGANFNFGAMGASAGLDINLMLFVANELAGGSHPTEEQYAIEAGYYWWKGGHTSPLNNNSITVHLAAEDTL